MRTPSRRLAALFQVAACTVVALTFTTPATAQLGGLKKKLKAPAATEAAPAAPVEATEAAAADGGTGGTIVLTADVVDRLLAGLKAGEAERQAAAKEDTPYGRYLRAVAAYEVAKPKCEAAQRTFPQRMAGDEKMSDKYSAYVDKMVDAQGRGNNNLAMAYDDSAMAMHDPSCVVRQPQQPDNYYEAQREVDNRGEKAAIKTSGFSRSEYGQVRERAEAILSGGTPPGDLSASEKSAVSARAGELKPLLGIREAPTERAKKAAPAAAPAPAPAPAAPAVPPGAAAMNACMTQNMQKHQPEMEALAKRAEAAHKAGDTATMMAIADTLQQLQMAGCR